MLITQHDDDDDDDFHVFYISLPSFLLLRSLGLHILQQNTFNSSFRNFLLI